MNETIISKSIEILTEFTLCNNCLGRLFAMLGTNLTNKERGKSIKTILLMKADEMQKNSQSDESKKIIELLTNSHDYLPALEFSKKIGLDYNKEKKSCYLCEDVFCNLEELVDKSINDLNKYEFKSFLVGTRVIDKIIEREDNLRSSFGVIWGESIKSELNREIGKIIFDKMENKEVNFKNPDILIEYLVPEFNYNITVNPIFLFGRYRKLLRGIPQTKWFCKKCQGKGCENCNFKGKLYDISVEELISEPTLTEVEGYDSKFHGAGREDIDAIMIGQGRPFVLELKGAKRRKIDLNKLEEKINNFGKGKVEVQDLKWVLRDVVRKIKALSKITKKTYKAIVELENEIPKDKLEEAEKILSNALIEQRTPKRVVHRRVDTLREKQVYSLKINVINTKKLEVIVEGQGGLYIKELISGDEGRTTPSLSEILNTKATCYQLDVLEVDFPKEMIN